MLELKAEKRDIMGKKLKAQRKAGKLPVVVYGFKEKASTPFFVETKQFLKVYGESGESAIVTLHTDKGDKDVLVHEIAHDPITDLPIHVDFLSVDKDKPVQVHVPLEFVGESPAVKNLGGILIKVMHEIEIEALPADLPRSIEVDLEKLIDFNSTLSVVDLKAPQGVTILTKASEVVASIAEPKEEEEEVPEVDLDAIEVEGKGKSEDAEGVSEATADIPGPENKKEKK